MVTRARTNKLTIMMNEAERAMLAKLAEDSGLSISDVIRQAVRREAIRVFGPPRSFNTVVTSGPGKSSSVSFVPAKKTKKGKR